MAVNQTALLKRQIAEGEKDLRRIVKDAQKRVEGRINDAVKKKNFATASSVREGLYRGITTEYIRLNRQVDGWVDERATKQMKAWHALSLESLNEEALAGKTFGAFSKKYADDIISRINPSNIDERVLLNARFGSMALEDINTVRVAVSDVIREGALTGMTNKQLSAEMMTRVAKIKPGLVLRDRLGRKMNADAYYAMLNRTLHTTVARETTASTMADAGFDLAFIEGGITQGSLEPNDPCSKWAGKIISMTGQTKGYPTYADALADGVFHPNCVHSARPLSSSEIPEAKKERAEIAKEAREGLKEVNDDRKERGLNPINQEGEIRGGK